jgi:hypothetical protein
MPHRRWILGCAAAFAASTFACASSRIGECVEARIVLDPIKSFVAYTVLGEMTRTECSDLCDRERRDCDWRRLQESVTAPQ